MHNAFAHHQLTKAQPVPEQWQPWQISPRVLLLSMVLVWHGTSLWPAWVSSWLCPSSWCTPRYLAGGAAPGAEGPWLCASAAQQQLQHWGVTNTVLVTNPEHSTIKSYYKEN